MLDNTSTNKLANVRDILPIREQALTRKVATVLDNASIYPYTTRRIGEGDWDLVITRLIGTAEIRMVRLGFDTLFEAEDYAQDLCAESYEIYFDNLKVIDYAF